MADRRRNRSGRSPLVSAMAISLLAIPGFALGLLAGVAWEDPGLLAMEMFGSGEDVAWGAADEDASEAEGESAAAPLPDVAASPRGNATRMRTEVLTPGAPAKESLPAAPAAAPRPVAASAPRPAPAPAARAASRAAPAPKGRFAVQVGAFGESAAAERLAAGLEAKGFAVYVSPGADAGDARWRVRVGPLATREEAERVADRLKRQEKLPTWVLDEDAV